jgi:HK97 family phage prohead protease
MLSPPRLGWCLDDKWRLDDGPPRAPQLDDPRAAVAELELDESRTSDLAELSVRDARGGDLAVECLAVPWNRWTTINSREGHFREQFAPGSVPTGLEEKLRMFWQHGDDLALGHMPIAEVTELRNEPDGLWAKATLLAGVPPLIVSGLKRKMFGASVRFKPLVVDVVRRPARSKDNPTGLEERVVRSASLREISICNYPAYSATSASLID